MTSVVAMPSVPPLSPLTPLTPLTWVIGRGGLLGQSLETTLRTRMWLPPRPIDWSGPNGGAVELRQQAGDFLRAVGDRPWSVAWCAGAGVTGTSASVLQLELDALRETLDALGGAPHGRDGAFFFASSAAQSMARPRFDAPSAPRSTSFPKPVPPKSAARPW